MIEDGSPDDDDLIGATIAGRYRIISRLGAGGMGTAYRAWDEQVGVPVVLKFPKREFLKNATFAGRFHREIRLLQGLTHPHIVPIIDIGDHGNLPFVVTRFLPGGSLSNRRLRDRNRKVRPNPPGMLHLWLPAVAEALDYIHAQQVVHRDVKPANIFFDAFWGAFLGDFGIAKVVGESDIFDKEQTLTDTHMGVGTEGYMAPEQFTPKATIDGRLDQYALAVIAYEMVAGVRPFTGATAHIIVEVTTRPVPPLGEHRDDLSAAFVEAVHRGLAKIPADRFGSCGEFATAVLRDVEPIEDEPGVARLLCPKPKCENILKLPTEAAGRKGKCPKCTMWMKVADDLGALWLLDEARRQTEAARATDTGMAFDDFGQQGDAPVIAPSQDEPAEALAPVPDDLPIVTPVRRQRRRARPRAGMWLGAAVAVVAAVATWMLWPAAPVVEPPPQPEPAIENPVAAARKKLESDPDDPEANGILGRHCCFVERSWDQGLPHLVKGPPGKVSDVARRELDAQAAQAATKPGALIRAAHGWWALVSGPPPEAAELPASEREAIAEHASALYRSTIGAVAVPEDIGFANDWLDGDKAFQGRVANLRPAARLVPEPRPPTPSPEPQPAPSATPETLAGLADKSPEIILDYPPIANSIGMEFKVLPPGVFQMGSADDPTEKPVHQVTLSKPFFIGIHEVTNAQWREVMGKTPSTFGDDDVPVHDVDWKKAMEFCTKLSARPAEQAKGRGYRLPTEAEWEYACRAETATRWSFGPQEAALGNHAWFAGNAGDQPRPVGKKQPNAWGLFDMHGNVSEWCDDLCAPYPRGDVQAPRGPADGKLRVGRGGSWLSTAWGCRSACRREFTLDYSGMDQGFRVVLMPAAGD